jgi:hypothetical protein
MLPEPAVVSRRLRDSTEPVRAVFIDFDGTLSVDNVFSEALLVRCQRECGCGCTATAGPGSLSALVASLPAANVTRDAFGPPERLERLRAFLARLAADGTVRVRLLSTSWYPVGAAAWRAYLAAVTSAAELEWPTADEVLALADPGPGLPADKGGAIAEHLADWGLAGHEALLVDDSEGNIASAAGHCDTVWLPQREGMPSVVLDYIEARALGCCSWTAAAVDGASAPMLVAAAGAMVAVAAVLAAAAFSVGRRRGETEMADKRDEELERQKQSGEASALLGGIDQIGPIAAATTAVRARKLSS